MKFVTLSHQSEKVERHRFDESGDISFFNSTAILLSKSHVIWWLLSDIVITLTTFLVIEIAEEVL